MQKNLKTRSSFARKTITLAFLPIIIFVWMFGWILTQLGNPGKSIETNTKVLQKYPKFRSFEVNSDNEAEKISNYPISA